MDGLIKVEDQELMNAFYEAAVFDRAIGIMRDVLSFDKAIEIVRKRDGLFYAAWSLAMQVYPQIREDVDSGIQWAQMVSFVGDVYLRRQ